MPRLHCGSRFGYRVVLRTACHYLRFPTDCSTPVCLPTVALPVYCCYAHIQLRCPPPTLFVALHSILVVLILPGVVAVDILRSAGDCDLLPTCDLPFWNRVRWLITFEFTPTPRLYTLFTFVPPHCLFVALRFVPHSFTLHIRSLRYRSYVVYTCLPFVRYITTLLVRSAPFTTTLPFYIHTLIVVPTFVDYVVVGYFVIDLRSGCCYIPRYTFITQFVLLFLITLHGTLRFCSIYVVVFDLLTLRYDTLRVHSFDLRSIYIPLRCDLPRYAFSVVIERYVTVLFYRCSFEFIL